MVYNPFRKMLVALETIELRALFGIQDKIGLLFQIK